MAKYHWLLLMINDHQIFKIHLSIVSAKSNNFMPNTLHMHLGEVDTPKDAGWEQGWNKQISRNDSTHKSCDIDFLAGNSMQAYH